MLFCVRSSLKPKRCACIWNNISNLKLERPLVRKITRIEEQRYPFSTDGKIPGFFPMNALRPGISVGGKGSKSEIPSKVTRDSYPDPKQGFYQVFGLYFSRGLVFQPLADNVICQGCTFPGWHSFSGNCVHSGNTWDDSSVESGSL